MSEQKTIKITIDQLGKPKVEAVGFHGVGCGEATANIEKALAGTNTPVTRVMKTEWFETATEGEAERMTW